MKTSVNVITDELIEINDFHTLWKRFFDDGFTLENLSSFVNVDISILEMIKFDEDNKVICDDIFFG